MPQFSLVHVLTFRVCNAWLTIHNTVGSVLVPKMWFDGALEAQHLRISDVLEGYVCHAAQESEGRPLRTALWGSQDLMIK